MKRKSFWYLSASIVVMVALLQGGCDKKKDSSSGCPTCGAMGPQGPNDGGGGDNGGGGNTEGVYLAPSVSANFSGAVGALILDPQTSSAGLRENGFNLDDSQQGENSFVKIKDDGEIEPILAVEKNDQNKYGGQQNSLPKIQTIAISPTKEIFLHFERPFIYRSQDELRYLPRPECEKFKNGPTPVGSDGKPEQMPQTCYQQGELNPNWKDPWQQENGFQCQIFKVSGGALEELISGGLEGAGGLECLDNLHFVDSWQANRTSVFQFDSAGNVYYPGSTPNGGGKMVVYKRDTAGHVTEVINANICVNDFLVTINGGVFYTGSSSCGSSNNSGGFFRYVAPQGSGLREIARDWWNFVYETAQNAAGDQAVFYGPDPRSSTTASWDSACLFRFDPSAGDTAEKTISNVITCGNNFDQWLRMQRTEDRALYGTGFEQNDRTLYPAKFAAWKAEFAERCAVADKVFAGGGSQINAVQQDSQGKIYVIGQVRKKKAGKVSCNVRIKGAHCVDKDGFPRLFTDGETTAKAQCSAIGGTWLWGNNGECRAVGDSNTDIYIPERSSLEGCLATPVDDATLILAHNAGHAAQQVRWFTRQEVSYNNVASELCTDPDSYSGSNFWDWSVSSYAYHTAAGTEVSESSWHFAEPVFYSEWWNCSPVNEVTHEIESNNNGSNSWLTEYKGLAEVDPVTNTLILRSSATEQAIRLWLIKDLPYYSSYDTSKGRYYLKRYNPDGSTDKLADGFETYNLSEGEKSGELYYDGLDFEGNQYSFGTMMDVTPFSRVQKPGLTGQVKTIIVMPK